MGTTFTPLTSVAAIEQAVAQSWGEPVLLYKHDPVCSISAAAYQELRRIDHPVALVDVARHDDLAQAVAAQTAIPHESPQVIMLWHAQPVWTASLWDITEPALRDALRRIPRGGSERPGAAPEVGGDDALMGRQLGDDTATGGSTGG